MADDPLHDNPRSPGNEDQRDFTDRFNTKLSAKQEEKFQEWLKAQSERAGRDLGKDLYDYDMRGLFKESAGADLGEGHGADKHKKPNHPTFSDESEYHGKDGMKGGTWGKKGDRDTFTPGETNRQYWPKEELQQYFQDIEPNADLLDLE